MEGEQSLIPHEDEINLLEYWRVIWKRRKLIGGLWFASVLLVFIICLLMTKIYESTATVLPPTESNTSSLASALAASSELAQAIPGISLPSLASNQNIFLSILKSRTMAQDIIDKFDLKTRYEADYTEDAIKSLEEATDIEVSDEGAISVTVEDKDPKIAADMANFYVTNLDRLLAHLGTTEASRERTFIAKRLAETEKELRQAEEALQRFQETHKAIALEEQVTGEVTAAATLKGEIIASEVQLEAMRSFATDANPDVIKLKDQITEMKRQLAQMQYGKGWDLPPESQNPGESREEIHIPFAAVPELGLEFARLTRDVKVQETVFTLLTQQFEQAKIAEARDTPEVQVLDKAIPAEKKSKPKTILIVAITGFISLFLWTFLALFLEYLKSQKQRQPHRSTEASS